MRKMILAVSGAGLVGLVAFLVVQFSSVSVDRNGVKVGGIEEAEAGCYEDGLGCLPPLSFTDVSGKEWTYDELSGKVVVINFWATWCRPCQHEVPDLAKVYRKYKGKGLVILGMMSDDPSDATLAGFKKTFGLDYPVVRMTRSIQEAFEYPKALPTNFIYSRNGHLKFSRPGAISAGDLENEIKALL